MFSNRYVRTIVGSRVFLQLGVWIRNFAVLLYVTDATHNRLLYVSLISVVEFAPIFLFALIGGTLADRWRPKRTMVWSDAGSAFSVLVVLLALTGGHWSALLLGTLVSASLSQLSQPSALKLYKRHIAPEQLQGVMALSQTLTAVFTVAGPVIGALVFTRFGIHVSLALTFVCFAASAFVLSRLPRDAQEERTQARAGFMAEMRAGVRYLWASRPLRALSAVFAATGLAAGLIQPLLLFIVIERLGQDKSFLQWLLMANGAAMLVGGAVIMTAAKRIRPQALLAIGLAVSAACTIVVGFSLSLTLSVAMQIVSGLFYPCVQAGIQTLIVRNTEAAFMGRVGGAITPIFMGMMVIGMALSGVLKSALSLVAVYTVSGCLLVLGALLLAPLFRREKQPAAG